MSSQAMDLASPEPSEIPLPFPSPGRECSQGGSDENLERPMAGLKLRPRKHKKKSQLHITAGEEVETEDLNIKERRPHKLEKTSKSKQERNRSKKVSHETVAQDHCPESTNEGTTADSVSTNLKMAKSDCKPSTCSIASPIVVKIRTRDNQSTYGENLVCWMNKNTQLYS